ncbi:T9SS type A sorting domain-containing protein [Polaribacter sp. M15]
MESYNVFYAWNITKTNIKSKQLNTLHKNNNSTAKLYDLQGNVVKTISPAVGMIDVEGLKSGNYILVIIFNDKTESHSILIR